MSCQELKNIEARPWVEVVMRMEDGLLGSVDRLTGLLFGETGGSRRSDRGAVGAGLFFDDISWQSCFICSSTGIFSPLKEGASLGLVRL